MLKGYGSINMMDIRKLNEIQLDKTADVSLEVGKAMLLATVVGPLIPGVGEKVGVMGSIVGIIAFIACYFFAMWLLRGVKRK